MPNDQTQYTESELHERLVFEAWALVTRAETDLHILDKRIGLSPSDMWDLFHQRSRLRKYLDFCEEFHIRLMHGELT